MPPPENASAAPKGGADAGTLASGSRRDHITARDIVGALACGRAGCPCAQSARRGHGVTHCPAHADRDPSLNVGERDGRVVVFCHAGCAQDAVIAALGARGLWPERRRTERAPAQVTRYEIREAEGAPVAVHVRREGARGKTFAWEQADGTPGLGGRRVSDLPLYGSERLGDLPDGATVVVTEGEKAADALRARGIAAVGTVTGAGGTPGVEALAALRRFRVVLWPDADDPGRAHMARIAEALHGLGIAARIVEWPDAPSGGDAADFEGDDRALRALIDTAKPWRPPPSEDGPALLDEVRQAIVRYVALPDARAADAITLWIAATHGQPAWDHATRLVLKSPVRRCGKTRLLEVVIALAHNPLPSANMSVAALVRSLSETDPPTIILDEADALFARRRGERSETAEELRGILNAGHARGWPYVRWNAQARRREVCPTFAMAAVAAIGDLPDTLEDRAVVIRMQRRAPGETVEPLRQRNLPALHALGERLHRWVRGRLDGLAGADPVLPVQDRAADVWAPLVAVADAAGGEWPERARQACVALTSAASDPDDGTLAERLLAHLRDVFDAAGVDRLPTAEIVERLNALEDAPWADLNRGRGLTPHSLGRMLRPYGVKTRNIRLAPGQQVVKGYRRVDLQMAFLRYLPPQTATPLQGGDFEYENPVADRRGGSATEPLHAETGDPESGSAASARDCSVVADVADDARRSQDGHVALAEATPQGSLFLRCTCGAEAEGYAPDGSPRCGEHLPAVCRHCGRPVPAGTNACTGCSRSPVVQYALARGARQALP